MRVTIVGGAAWNLMPHVDRLPDDGSATVHPTLAACCGAGRRIPTALGRPVGGHARQRIHQG